MFTKKSWKNDRKNYLGLLSGVTFRISFCFSNAQKFHECRRFPYIVFLPIGHIISANRVIAAISRRISNIPLFNPYMVQHWPDGIIYFWILHSVLLTQKKRINKYQKRIRDLCEHLRWIAVQKTIGGRNLLLQSFAIDCLWDSWPHLYMICFVNLFWPNLRHLWVMLSKSLKLLTGNLL